MFFTPAKQVLAAEAGVGAERDPDLWSVLAYLPPIRLIVSTKSGVFAAFDTAGEFGYAARGWSSLANLDCRVCAGDSPASQCPIRVRLIDMASNTCRRCVFVSPT